LLTADGILLGIKSGSHFAEREIKLAPGDVITLYTDGLTEAAVDGHMLGRDRVARAVAAKAHLSAQEIADSLRDMLLDYVHGRITDDVAMVVVKIT